MNERKRTWLITGVSTGLGRALAEAVLRRGEVVIGTLRKREQQAEFEALAPGRALTTLLDVTDRNTSTPASRRPYKRPAASMWS